MNSAQSRFDAEHDDQPFNLAPAAIVQVVGDIAARLGSICRLQSGGFAKLVDERFCFDNIARFDIERQKHRFVGLSSSGSGGRQARVKWPVCKAVNRARVSPFRQSNWLAEIKHDDVSRYRLFAFPRCSRLPAQPHWWQRGRMSETNDSQPRLAGGIFIALGLLFGAIGGVALNQPSAGMMIGFGTGVAIALLVWLFDRKRA